MPPQLPATATSSTSSPNPPSSTIPVAATSRQSSRLSLLPPPQHDFLPPLGPLNKHAHLFGDHDDDEGEDHDDGDDEGGDDGTDRDGDTRGVVGPDGGGGVTARGASRPAIAGARASLLIRKLHRVSSWDSLYSTLDDPDTPIATAATAATAAGSLPAAAVVATADSPSSQSVTSPSSLASPSCPSPVSTRPASPPAATSAARPTKDPAARLSIAKLDSLLALAWEFADSPAEAIPSSSAANENPEAAAVVAATDSTLRSRASSPPHSRRHSQTDRHRTLDHHEEPQPATLLAPPPSLTTCVFGAAAASAKPELPSPAASSVGDSGYSGSLVSAASNPPLQTGATVAAASSSPDMSTTARGSTAAEKPLAQQTGSVSTAPATAAIASGLPAELPDVHPVAPTSAVDLLSKSDGALAASAASAAATGRRAPRTHTSVAAAVRRAASALGLARRGVAAGLTGIERTTPTVTETAAVARKRLPFGRHRLKRDAMRPTTFVAVATAAAALVSVRAVSATTDPL
ncbi:hypothetical protein HK405_011581, partial [Cladochytrium tenue]